MHSGGRVEELSQRSFSSQSPKYSTLLPSTGGLQIPTPTHNFTFHCTVTNPGFRDAAWILIDLKNKSLESDNRG